MSFSKKERLFFLFAALYALTRLKAEKTDVLVLEKSGHFYLALTYMNDGVEQFVERYFSRTRIHILHF